MICGMCLCFFFFNETAPTEIYTYLPPLSLHDALPISAADGTAKAGAAAAGAAPVGAASAAKPATAAAPTRDAAQRTQLSASGKPMRTQPPSVSARGQPEQIKGVRRNMARVMADAHAKVVATTLSDDADIHAQIGSAHA